VPKFGIKESKPVLLHVVVLFLVLSWTDDFVLEWCRGDNHRGQEKGGGVL
jgi:hypothetical protein